MTKKSGPSAEYLVRAKALAKAIDIARSVRRGVIPRRADLLLVRLEDDVKRKARTRHPAYATLARMKFLEAAVFRYWNESGGAHIDKFWREIAKRRLPFRRLDPIDQALELGVVTNDDDYKSISEPFEDDRLTASEKEKLRSIRKSYEAERANRN